jgi:hypothetical protein
MTTHLTPADEGIEAVKLDDAIAIRHEAMVEAINYTIGALRVHQHWAPEMARHLMDKLEAALRQ